MQTTTTFVAFTNSPLFWAALLLTLGFVMPLAYIYSGKDRRITLLFTLCALFLLLLVASYDSWSLYFQTHFVGRFDEEGIPYRVSREGWLGLWDAWPLWSLPTLIFSVILSLGARSINQFLLRNSRSAFPPLFSPAL